MRGPSSDVDEFVFEAELPWKGHLLDAPVTGICRIDRNNGVILDVWISVLTPDKRRGRYLLSEADGELWTGVTAILADYQDVIDEMVREFHQSMDDADRVNDRLAEDRI
jgi:hypothetical protein